MGPAVHEMEPNIAIRTMNRGRIGLEAISWIGIGYCLLTGIANIAAAQSGDRYHRRRLHAALGGETLRFHGHDGSSLSPSLQVRATHRSTNRRA
jgi:hypothetical protein